MLINNTPYVIQIRYGIILPVNIIRTVCKGRQICDMIKGNESDVADIVSEILAKKEFKFFILYCFQY